MILGRPISRVLGRKSDDRGAAAVEFALVVPLLVVLIFVAVVGGSLYLDQLHLQSAARNGARIGSVAAANACSTATTELAGNSVGSVSCSVLSTCTTGTFRIQLSATQTVSVPLLGDRKVVLNATSSYGCS